MITLLLIISGMLEEKLFLVMLLLSFLSAISVVARAVLPIMIIRERVSPDNFPVMFAVIDIFTGCGSLLGGYLAGKLCIGLHLFYRHPDEPLRIRLVAMSFPLSMHSEIMHD